MALPTFVQGSSFFATGATTCAIPTGSTTDDIMLLAIETANQAISIVTPAGWVAVTGSPQGTGSGATSDTCSRMSVFWKRHTGSESSVTIPDSGDHQIGGIMTYRGCPTSGDPWNAIASDIETTASTSITWPSVTTTVSDCLVVLITGTGQDTTNVQVSGVTNGALANIQQRANAWVTTGGGGGVAIFDGEKATAGVVGNTTGTRMAALR
jgi:hypothetical protein